jgi:hypothetical protein
MRLGFPKRLPARVNAEQRELNIGGATVTKFEQVGVELQYEASNKHEANRSFKYSCRVCCERGMRIECDRCAIAVTHAITVAALDTAKER